ncbi:MAG: putative toxin-antitoxin system toxin component, PIN family [Anaerolineales bacterium]|nr:MAG: putative toxin-antitoxin system toxin component, PIN family [Anaerolineales bacterium]
MLRVVLDTNQFVSSVLVRQGLPAQVLDAWRRREFLLITSPFIIAEIRSTLSYPRIRRKYPLTDDDVERLVTLLEQDALVVPDELDVTGAIPADPTDDMVLACAVEGQADLIVSGDHHLLSLGEYQGIPIVTAREFLERLQTAP